MTTGKTKIKWIVRNVETSGYINQYYNTPEIRMELIGNIESIDADCTRNSIASYVHNLLNGKSTGISIKKVHFNPPATVVLWEDGTKTVVKIQDDEEFDPEKGLAMAISKKALGNQGNYYETIKKWCEPYWEKEESEVNVTLQDILSALTGLTLKKKEDDTDGN